MTRATLTLSPFALAILAELATTLGTRPFLAAQVWPGDAVKERNKRGMLRHLVSRGLLTQLPLLCGQWGYQVTQVGLATCQKGGVHDN